MWDEDPRLVVVARGRAATGDLPSAGRRTASFYADPAAWLVVDAVQAALDLAGDDVRAGPDVGVLSVSDHGTAHTMRAVAAGTARGVVSPLRFAGASPGSLAGLACVVFGFRGPSLMLCMSPYAARPVASAITLSWLRAGKCRHVVVAEHEAHGAEHRVAGLIVRRHEG
ncbi:hypothetical protein [Streptosporangium sp. NPDC000396]|uniref:hypothetical protein n=1 Tax=Streptosporangium sp. NPDC000396 TaxID=3366185 RepID=UPI0036A1967B